MNASSSAHGGSAVARAIRAFSGSALGPPALLLVAAVVGLVWVNVDLSSYERVWEQMLELGVGDVSVDEDLHGWVNDAIMVVFFFSVGIEIKRELVVGELRDPRTAALPVIAAVGGMIAPALAYTVINAVGDGGDSAGWAIPVATDIAFTVGVLALLGSRVPVQLRLFVLTLAIADDVGGIAIIAFFFADDISAGHLVAAAVCIGAILVMRAAGVASPLLYVPVGIALWFTVLQSGVEATIAGVILGLLCPATPVRGRDVIGELEHRLAPWIALVVLPLFAVANAGVVVDGGVIADAVRSPVSVGIAAGLVLGKPIGITAATFFALRMGIGTLPASVDRALIAPVSVLAGIGFTVALFVAELSFDDPEILDQAKLGVLAGSFVAGLAGSLLYLAVHRRRSQAREPEVVAVS